MRDNFGCGFIWVFFFWFNVWIFICGSRLRLSLPSWRLIPKTRASCARPAGKIPKGFCFRDDMVRGYIGLRSKAVSAAKK